MIHNVGRYWLRYIGHGRAARIDKRLQGSGLLHNIMYIFFLFFLSHEQQAVTVTILPAMALNFGA